MAVQTDELDLYKREQNAAKTMSKKDVDNQIAGMEAGFDQDGAEQRELDGIQAATQKAERNGDSNKAKKKGIRGRLKSRKSKAILGFAGFGGATGVLLGGAMFFGPIFGVTDMVKGLSDFGFGPTENIRVRRQGRLIYDYYKNRAAGVREGRKIGSYNTKLEKGWQDFNLGRFSAQAEIKGYRFQYDPFLRDLKGNLVNVARDGETFKKRVPSYIDSPDGTRLNLTNADGIGLRDVRQRDLIPFTRKLLKDVYPGKVIGAVKRAHYRGFINAVTGVDWSRLFSQEGGDILKKAYRAILDPNGRYNPEGDARAGDTDASTGETPPAEAPDPNPDNPGGTVSPDPSTLDDLNKTKLTAFDRLKSGLNPRTVFRSLGAGVRASFRTSIGAGSIIIGLASIACLAKNLFDGDVQAKWTRYQSVVAYGSFLLGVAGEILNSGTNVSLEGVGDLYNQFISYEKIVVDDSGNWIEIVKSVGAAASVQRANGREVISGEELEPQNYIEVDNNAVKDIFVSIGSLISLFPDGISGAVCGALDSIWGQVVGFFAGIGECFISGGSLCYAGEIAQELLFALWGDEIMEAVFGLATGNDLGIIPFGPPQTAEIFAEAIGVIDSEQSRGGIPIDNPQYNLIVAQYLDQRDEDIKELPFFERYFAVSTPGSIGQSFALWKGEAIHKSWLENAASLIQFPFKAFSSLFSRPALAQTDSSCLSINDQRAIESREESGITCEPHDNFRQQKYSYDANLQCDGKTIELLEGYNELDDEDNNYGSDWVEEQVLLIMQGGSAEDENGNTLTVDCEQFEDKQETALKIAEVCHGLLFDGDEATIDNSVKHSYYNNPEVHGDKGAADRNDDVRKYCMTQDPFESILWQRPDNLQLYALIGRYVDDIMQQDGLVLLGGGFDDAEIVPAN